MLLKRETVKRGVGYFIHFCNFVDYEEIGYTDDETVCLRAWQTHTVGHTINGACCSFVAVFHCG